MRSDNEPISRASSVLSGFHKTDGEWTINKNLNLDLATSRTAVKCPPNFTKPKLKGQDRNSSDILQRTVVLRYALGAPPFAQLIPRSIGARHADSKPGCSNKSFQVLYSLISEFFSFCGWLRCVFKSLLSPRVVLFFHCSTGYALTKQNGIYPATLMPYKAKRWTQRQK